MSGDIQSFYKRWIGEAEQHLASGRLDKVDALIEKCADVDGAASADGLADGMMDLDTWQAFDSLCRRFAEVTR